MQIIYMDGLWANICHREDLNGLILKILNLKMLEIILKLDIYLKLI